MSRIPEFLEALEKMKEVHISKNEDYASKDNPFSNFDESTHGMELFGNNRDKSFVWPIYTKLARLATLLNKEGKPNNESIEDTFIDIANYILLWRSDFIRRNKSKFDLVREDMNKGMETIGKALDETNYLLNIIDGMTPKERSRIKEYIDSLISIESQTPHP